MLEGELAGRCFGVVGGGVRKQISSLDRTDYIDSADMNRTYTNIKYISIKVGIAKRDMGNWGTPDLH